VTEKARKLQSSAGALAWFAENGDHGQTATIFRKRGLISEQKYRSNSVGYGPRETYSPAEFFMAPLGIARRGRHSGRIRES
jgi:hypothetical protein